MEARNKAMNTKSGIMTYRKSTVKKLVCSHDKSSGNSTVTNIIKTIIIMKAIARYLNFNGYTPKISIYEMIKERAYYVNLQEQNNKYGLNTVCGKNRSIGRFYE